MLHTVLVVDDEEDLREMIRDGLQLSGYNVVTAREGQDAFDQISRIPHLCLVLLDLVMPGMDGWDFLRKMRERPELASVPVVVHSSMRGRAPQGATLVLQKPTRFGQLLSVVQDYCVS
jgi:CheY-like chemotaxis protein